MVGYILKKSLSILFKRPVMIWGISLLYLVITALISSLGYAVPIIAIPVILTLGAGISAVYLNGYNDNPVNTKQLFAGFSKDNLFRVMGGMCWYFLWTLLWSFIPVVGVIKAYSYRFTPYILITRPEIDAVDALKISMLETKGHKMKMFLTDLLIAAAIVVITGILAVLTLVPYINILFAVITFLFSIALVLFLPMFVGLVQAGFYQEAKLGIFPTAPRKSASRKSDADKTEETPKSDEADATPESVETDATPESVATDVTPENVENEATPESNEPESEIAPTLTLATDGAWYCPECGTLNEAETFFCPECGTKHED